MDRTLLRMLVLVIVHIAAMIASDKLMHMPANFLSPAVACSQIGLLAVWLVVGQWTWPKRVVTTLAASAILVWSKSIQPRFESLIPFLVNEFAVAAGLLVARYGPPKVRLIKLSGPVVPRTRFQFSLRQVMVQFVALAVVLTAARIFRAYVTAANTTDGELSEAAGAIQFLIVGTVLCGVVALSWIATWATLSIARLWSRITLALVIAVSLGFLFSYCFSPFMPYLEWYYCALVLVSQSIFTMASLLVVRAGGYRLVGRKEMATLAVTT